VLAGPWSFTRSPTIVEGIVARATLAYLEHRYLTLEREIVDALRHHPADHFAVADLKYRKSIIADEIQHNRRLVERFACAS
jgi:hypothetical protein